jgi:hypothetical protein
LSALLTCLDLLAAAGVVFAIVLGIRGAWQNRRDVLGWAMLFFACVAVFLWRVDDWPAAVDYARILSPLLIFLAVLSFKRFSWLNIAPFSDGVAETRDGCRIGGTRSGQGHSAHRLTEKRRSARK